MIIPKTINIKGQLLDLSHPIVMGILNVTPDSFYADSRSQSEKQIRDRVEEILEQGGDIIDIGGQSSNPKSAPLTAEEEMLRLDFALQIICQHYPEAHLSVDTFYSHVARQSVERYGVAVINDISGGAIDENMFATVADLGVPYILMHMRGTPQTMTQQTDYKDLIQEVFYYFSEKVNKLRKLGVNDIIIDPGFGFSKTLEQNYELMSNLDKFSIFDLPLLVGVSRKSMIYNLLGINSSESLNGTTVLNTFAIERGANILRVHDVKEAVETIKIVTALNK